MASPMGLGPVGGGRRPVAGPAAVWPSSVDLEVDGPLQIEATPDRGEAGPGEVNAGEVFALSTETEDATLGAEAMQSTARGGCSGCSCRSLQRRCGVARNLQRRAPRWRGGGLGNALGEDEGGEGAGG